MKIVAMLVPVAVLALVACTTGDPGRGGAADDSFTLPSDGKDGQSQLPGSTFRGVLSFDDIEGGCAFLAADDGRRYEVIYPDGWTLERGTGNLRGPAGEDLRAGTAIEVDGTIATDRSSICQIGPIVVATTVRVAAP